VYKEPSTPTPRKPIKKGKGIKKERSIKAKPSTPVTAKRPRPASAEVSIPKKNVGAVTRRQAGALTALVETAPAEDDNAGEEDLALGRIFGDI
jgi:hypothetical protein